MDKKFYNHFFLLMDNIVVGNVPLQGLTGILRRLVMKENLTEDDARKIMVEASAAKSPIHTYLMEKKLVPTDAIAVALAQEFTLPYVDLRLFDLSQAPIHLVKEEWLQSHEVLPLWQRGNRLFVGVADPTNTRSIDELRFQTPLAIDTIIVDPAQIRHSIEAAITAKGGNFGKDLEDSDGLDGLETESGDDMPDEKTLENSGNDDAPVVKFVNKVLLDAIKKGASDIHFEPYETELRVRVRLDGILMQVAKAPQKLSTRISARLKVMAALDIAEKRVPQDGRIKLNISKTRQMDFRVSTCPTLFGEKIVLRLLDGSAAKLGIDKLGYEDDQKELFLNAISKPYGMVLVTGPTGSGKTVSLYTALNILNTEERNISTAEDPVEIRVAGINQVQVNPKKGMTFAAALRSFLRQDPDVIMVGEIRDLETAEIAVKAAQTGHMVLSTLHTNDAPQTISRMMNMGIAPYNITSSVMLIIAQRLARRLCNHCKRPVDLPEASLLSAGFTREEIAQGLELYEAVGCTECNLGYKGRVGIYQVMPMLESIQKIVLEGGNAMQIAEVALAAGVQDLRGSALRKAKQGVTSLTEIDRVTKG